MIYLAIYLLALPAALALHACGSSPAAVEPGPYARIAAFAGDGQASQGADDVPLLKASFYLPQDLTFGPDGRPYILDWNNHRVRLVYEGRVRTLIGTGELGDAPSGPALEIGLNHPTHISFLHVQGPV